MFPRSMRGRLAGNINRKIPTPFLLGHTRGISNLTFCCTSQISIANFRLLFMKQGSSMSHCSTCIPSIGPGVFRQDWKLFTAPGHWNQTSESSSKDSPRSSGASTSSRISALYHVSYWSLYSAYSRIWSGPQFGDLEIRETGLERRSPCVTRWSL